MMRRYVHILPYLLLIALLWVGACKRLPADGSEEYGTLALQIGIGDAETKTDTSPNPLDGDTFHNILVVVAEKDGTVVDHVLKEYPCTGDNIPLNQEPKDVVSTSSDWIYFVGLKVGYYQVYAYANIDEVAWQQEDFQADGLTVSEIATKIYEGSGFPDRQFATLTGTSAPAFPDHCMLLTGHDELYVGVDPYIGRIDLYRPVVKFEVVLDNHTPFHLQLTDLYFNKFNASKGYLIEHLDEKGHPLIPDGNEYRSLPAFTGPANVGSLQQATVYSVLLYENRLGQDYRMFAKVRFADANGDVINDESNHPLVDPNDASKPLSKTLSSTSVRHVPYEDIRDLPRGQSMNVLAVTPNTGNGGFLGWIFIQGGGGQLAFNSATYNFEDSFRSKAEALLNNKDIGPYYQLTLSKESDSDKYHLRRGDLDLFAKPQIDDGVAINGLYLTEGSYQKNNGDPLEYPISSEFAGSLCRFTQTEESNARSLLYNNSKLKMDGNANYGNRMWTFYEIHPEGTVLKLIDRESSRVSPLTQMVRGQKLTAVMNVYYQSATGEFTFSLDNTYWENGHNPSHTFE